MENKHTNEIEWLRVPEATRRFGMSRSLLYEIIGEGAVESVALTRPGNRRGIRLISAQSLRDYVEGFREQPEQNPAA